MAAVINADGITIVGTVEQIAALLGLLRQGATIANLDRANLVIVAEPLTRKDLKTAIETTPKRRS